VSPGDRRSLGPIQAVVLGLPLFLGGRQPIAVAVAAAVVMALLAATVRARARAADAPAPVGVAALAAFVVLALATTVPLPPAVLHWLAPATERLYREMLPGWPGAGGWRLWRPIALDPFGAWEEIGRLSIGLGVFAVVVAHPWEAREEVFARLLVTLVVGGAAVALLGLVAQVLGNGSVMWVTDEPVTAGRASGPFVNPNHFAAWVAMAVPVALAWTAAALRRVRERLVRSASSGRGRGVHARSVWVSALVTHQRRLVLPLALGAASALMLVAVVASGSRGGMAALLVGLAVVGAGIGARLSAGAEASRVRRLLPVAVALVLVAASAGSIAVWATKDADEQVGDVADPSFASRVAVARAGLGVVRDHLLLGTGLGSWLHAFRPYQVPPVEGGVWDHAHDDYVEVAAETGLVGLGLLLLFVGAIARAARGRGTPEAVPAHRRRRASRPAGFEAPDWRAALGEDALLRVGLAGGLAAILVQSLVDFGLRLPANLLLAMLLAALLVPGKRGSGRRPVLGPAVLLTALALAWAPQLVSAVQAVAGLDPLAPSRARALAERLVAEEGEARRDEALALVRHALEWSPADRESHEALATILGPGAAGDAALARALALEPWSSETRDALGLRLWAEGDRRAAAAELEESMRRFPYLETHAYLAAESGSDVGLDVRQAGLLIRQLAEGDTATVRLASLDPEMVAAIERGLRRALDETPAGDKRVGIIGDLATLLEARERWADAAEVLRAEAERSVDGAANLARAAEDYLRAGAAADAERMLLSAVLRTPEQGDLYKTLALDVYSERGDYETAQAVLRAGERNAFDLLPVYDGVTEVLAKRESRRVHEVSTPADATLDEEVP